MWSLCPFLELGKKPMEGVTETKVWSRDERMDHLETAIPWNRPQNQPPNADTIAHTSKILLKKQTNKKQNKTKQNKKKTRYGCLL